MLLSYLVRKNEEQEAQIRKLKVRLSQYVDLQTLDSNNDDQSEVRVRKLTSDLNLRLPSIQNLDPKDNVVTTTEEEDQNYFDKMLLERHQQVGANTVRSKRFNSICVNNQVHSNLASARKKERVEMLPSYRRCSQRTYINDQEMLTLLKDQLLKSKALIQKEQGDKIKLVNKLKELNSLVKQLKLSQQKGQALVEKKDIKLQTQDMPKENSGELKKETVSTGMNTDPFESQVLKIQSDQFEENRLRENIQFWKSKVDQLLNKQKENLNQQLAQNKMISYYEQQVEQLKQQIKLKEEIIEQAQYLRSTQEEMSKTNADDFRKFQHQQEVYFQDSLVEIENSKLSPSGTLQNEMLKNSSKQLSDIHHIQDQDIQKNIDKYYSPPIDRNIIQAQKQEQKLTKITNKKQNKSMFQIDLKSNSKSGKKPEKVLKQKHIHKATSKANHGHNISVSRSKTPSSRRSKDNSQVNIQIQESQFPKKKSSRNNFSISTTSNKHLDRLTPSIKSSTHSKTSTKPHVFKKTNQHQKKQSKVNPKIQTVDYYHNQTIIEVLERLQNEQEEEPFGSFKSVSENTDKQHLSPLSQVKNILEVFKQNNLDIPPPSHLTNHGVSTPFIAKNSANDLKYSNKKPNLNYNHQQKKVPII